MNDFLVQLTVVAVLANVALLVAALVIPRIRRPHGDLAAATPSASADSMAFTLPPSPVTVAALPSETAPAPSSSSPPEAQGDSNPEMRTDADDSERQRRFSLPPDEDYPTPESVEAFLAAGQRPESGPRPMIDDRTGLETGLAWEMAVDREEKRLARYGHTVTVVVAELDRLDALAARLGQENADRLVPPVAMTFRRFARAADLVARTGHARFQVLMPETDEIQAINFVERVRDACDMWLDASAISVRLVTGWAHAGTGTTIRDAVRVAEQRMHADRARPSWVRARASGSTVASEPAEADLSAEGAG